EAQGDVPFECSKLHQGKMALDPTGAGELIELLGTAIDRVRGRHRVHAVPYCTDAPCIAESGVPTVVFGPGDIAQAHTKDEWVALDEVDMAAEILFQLALNA